MATDANKPYGDVKYADPKNGKYPVDTEEHAKAAWSYINMPKNAAMYPMNGVTLAEVKDRIKAACRKFGIEISDDSDSGSMRAESLAPYHRSFPLEDVSVRSSGRDGREVTAYAAVFDTPAEVRDQDGHYMETIDPVAFNRAISDAAPQGSRRNWKVGVFYNHGMTLYGTPSEKYSMPVGVPVDIKADKRGLLTVTRYNRSQLSDEIIDGLESGAIPGYSFTGVFRRSSPMIPPRGFRADRRGNLPTVRRTESTLQEYGPTPRPIYDGAEVVGMRAEMLLGALASNPDMASRMLAMFADGAPQDSPSDAGAPEWDSPSEDSPLVRRSARSVQEEIQANRAAFLLRQARRAGNDRSNRPPDRG